MGGGVSWGRGRLREMVRRVDTTHTHTSHHTYHTHYKCHTVYGEVYGLRECGGEGERSSDVSQV